MQSGSALTIVTGPVGLMLIAAILCAVFAAHAWLSAMAVRDQDASANSQEHNGEDQDDIDPACVPARGLRRTTRGPRVFDQEEQERIVRDIASTARGKARSAHGKSSKVA